MGLAQRFYTEVVRDISSLGGFVFSVSIGLILGYMSFIQRDVDILLYYVIGQVMLVTIVAVTRLIYFKDRPEKMQYKGVIERIEASSFPSLHAARGMFCALTVGSIIGGPWAYLWFGFFGLGIGISRILLRRHDWIDIFFGWLLAIGVFFGVL